MPVPPDPGPARPPGEVVFVVGMHRSGTSALAGSLAAAGLDLPGANVTGGRHNARGNYEHQPLVYFQERMLQAAGASWAAPPDRVAWTPKGRVRARRLLRDHPGPATVGFKDPRTLLHLHLWQELDRPLTLVGTVRSPAAVARSLVRRGDLEAEPALALWEHYNRILLAAHRSTPFPIVDFDVPVDRLAAQVGEVARWLGLPRPDRAGSFLEDGLRSVAGDGPVVAVPAPVEALHRELVARSLEGDGPVR